MVMFDWETPVEEEIKDEVVDEAIDNKKIDRVMKIFEALSEIEQQAAFARMWEILTPELEVPAEGDMPPNPMDIGWWAPMDAWLPMWDDKATWSPFNALQDRLKNI